MSSRNKTAEQLHRPNQIGPTTMVDTPARGESFAGMATIASGSATKTVSTTLVQSDSHIFISEQPSSIGPHSGGTVVANSLVDGVSFALARSTGNAIAWDSSVSWELKLR